MNQNEKSFEEELKSAFLEEAIEILIEAEGDFLRLEKGADEPLWEKLSRVAHNLKGGARTAGFEELADVMHALETVLQRLRKGNLPLDSDAVGRLLRVRDRVLSEIAAVRNGTSPKMALEDIKAALVQWESSEVTLKAGPGPSLDGESIRIDLGRIDRLVNDVGELVVLTNALREVISSEASPKVKSVLSSLRTTLRETQDLVLSLRMVPARGLLQRAQRVVHDVSARLGKPCDLELIGEAMEVDKVVAERLSDPLMHLVNNALDHGLEEPDERRKLGKPERGKIQLSATHRGNRMEIECRDDGRGIDAQTVRKKAVERGLISSNDPLSQSQVLDLIFSAGFSTAQTVTQISGRGVGMDVVRAAAEFLGGTITIETQVGKGTTFRLSLPLNMAILEAALVEAEGVRWLVPLSDIEEVIRVESEPKEIQHRGVNWRAVRMPGKERKHASRVALLVQGKNRWACLAEEITGPQSVVVRPLGRELSTLAGITGGAVLPDGRPALVMDLSAWAESEKWQS